MFNMILFHINIYHLTHWAVVLFVWMVMNYGFSNDRVGVQEIRDLDERKRWVWRRNVVLRSLIGASVVFMLPGFDTKEMVSRLLLFLMTCLIGCELPFIRDLLARSETGNKAIAESEMIHNLIYILLSGLLINQLDNPISFPAVLQDNIKYVALVFIFLATLTFLINGGTYIVRGILDKTGTIPKKEEKVDQLEYNRGRLIGNLERILLFLFVLAGSYEALGFIIAAKGLIRAKEFNDRNFAEYFIIGSLSSALVAVVVGVIVRFFMNKLL